MSRRRAISFVIAALLAIGVGLLVDRTDLLHKVELATVDLRFSVRGDERPPSDIVIVGIDDKTLDTGKASILPLSRARHAKVIQQLTKAGAKVIAYDVQFTEVGGDTEPEIEADNALLEAVRAGAPRVIIGSTHGAPDGRVFTGGEAFEYSRAMAGNTVFPEDADGRVRRMPFATEGLTNIGLAAARLYDGKLLPASRSEWIDYPGPPGTFPELSFVDVERGDFDPAAVRGKLVVVGQTALRARDVYAAPMTAGERMSSPEVVAASAATALAGFPLQQAPGWVGIVALIVLALLPLLVALRFGSLIALVAGLGAGAVYAVVCQIAFQRGTILPLVAPLAAASVAMIGALVLVPPASREWLDRQLDRLTGRRGNQRTRRLRAVLLVSAASFVAVAGLVAYTTNVLRPQDTATVDKRFRIRGPVAPPNDVVVAGIDDKTLAQPGVQYPLDRKMYADAIHNLAKAGARVIALDVEFSEPSGKRKSDEALVEAVRDAGNVVLSTTDEAPLSDTQLFRFGRGLAYSRGIPAATNVLRDPDARVRRMQFGFTGKPLFAIAAAEEFRGRAIDYPNADSAWIDYAGAEHTLPYISLIDAVDDKFPASAVRGKAVVIGAAQSSLQDTHQTSTTTKFLMPGPEVQATSIATALAGFPLRSAPWWLNVLLIVAVGVAAPLVALRRGILIAVLAGVVVIALFLVAAQLAFERKDLLVTVVYPLAAGVVGILLTAAIHGLSVAFEREQARDAFARFVPEAVVDQVLADSDGVRLGGVRREGTVMFSDLRGFTSFSESLEPERVIEALNRYLTEMSEAILDHGGTLVAYMGDGIMAVFGAPLVQDDHADRALEAAREMLERLEGFNQWLRDEDLNEGFKMGIGLNSGPVMSGNVGSERRLEYTALGDTTNTAARLEGMTKGTPHQLYVADTTKQMLTRPADDLVAVGEASVRGRKAKVLLWSLDDSTDMAEAPEPAKPERVEA